MAGVQLEGDEALRSSLAAATADLQSLAGADEDAGEVLASRVIAEAPKLTGYMAGTVESAGATITVGAPYAGIVEARTGFAARAVLAEQQRVVEIYADGIATAVAQVRGK